MPIFDWLTQRDPKIFNTAVGAHTIVRKITYDVGQTPLIINTGKATKRQQQCPVHFMTSVFH